MQSHFLKVHAHTVQTIEERVAQRAEANQSETPRKKARLDQLSILRHGDLSFGKARQDKAERLLCILKVCFAAFSFLCVTSSISLSTHCHMPPWKVKP